MRRRPRQIRAEAAILTRLVLRKFRDQVRARFAELAKQVKPTDAVVLTLIGHGTYDGIEYKFNLPGPDITGQELASLLDHLPASRQLVVNATSSSGGSIDVLLRPTRVVICATKTGSEKNATVFARYWAEALRDPAADMDKNETITALEAFKYAEQKTAGFFETNKRLATEHALLEDTGKGEGVKNPGPENGQGLVASHFNVMHLGAVAAQINNPEKLALQNKKEELEQKIDGLKYQKAAMEPGEYKKELTAALVELAKVQADLDK